MTTDASAAGRERTWTVLELLQWTTEYFERSGIEGARLDAEVLLAHALEIDRLRLYIDYEKPVLPAERDRYRELVRRRATERMPVSLLLGKKEFWSLELNVTGDVLTPRPDTETLVEAALAWLPKKDHAYQVLEIGTGSGAIALAIASERPQVDLTATDLSDAALQIASDNADKLRIRGIGERVRFRAGDLFEPVAGERFDLIISNPPYVAERDRESLPPELAHEPSEALFAGEDGLDVIRRLVKEAGNHLSSGGGLLIELSPEQADEVEQVFAAAGFESIERRFDIAKRARVIVGRWP